MSKPGDVAGGSSSEGQGEDFETSQLETDSLSLAESFRQPRPGRLYATHDILCSNVGLASVPSRISP